VPFNGAACQRQACAAPDAADGTALADAGKEALPAPPGVSDAHVPNILQRDFCATVSVQKWGTDITELNVKEHKLYLSACLDLYNGDIVAHRMARRPVFKRVSCLLEAVFPRVAEAAGLMLYSDPGLALQDAAVPGNAGTQSMSRKGNCFDHAAMESFCGTLKAEFFHLARIVSIAQPETGVDG
jgi:putative transposase